MEYEYMTQETETSESYQTILNLFKKRMDAAALLKDGASGDKGIKDQLTVTAANIFDDDRTQKYSITS